MKSFITIFLVAFTLTAYCQPTEPILRIETGMHTAVGNRISTDASGKYLLTCSDDKTARLWDAATGTLFNTFRIPVGGTDEGKIYACSLSPDGKIAALGGWTGDEWDNTFSIYLINIQTGEIIHRIKGLPRIIDDLEFSPDGRWLAAGFVKVGVRIYDTGGWGEYKKLEGYAGDVYNISFNPGGGLATTCEDGKLRLYNSRFELVNEKSGLAGQDINSIAFNPAGNLLAVGYNDDAIVEVRDASDLSLLYKPSIEESEDNKGGLSTLSFSADGSKLYGGGISKKNDKAGFWKRVVRCWDNAGRGKYTDLLLMKQTVMDIKPLPVGSMAIIGAYPDITVISSSNEISWYRSAGNNNYSATDKSHFRINISGSSIGFTPFNQPANSFDVPQRKLLEEQSLYPAPMDANNGTTVDRSGENTYGPVINGKKISFLSKYERCNSGDISSNGKQIVLGTEWNLYLSDNNAEKIWKTALPSSAYAVNISGNDKVVTAALSDGTIRWYSMAEGKELLAYYLNEDKKRWVLFTPSGYYDASPGAEDFLSWHVNNGPDKTPNFYPVSRFREQFYRPDIIDAIFETYNETEAIVLANKRKGKIEGQEQTTDITKKLPPVISISSPANGSIVSTNMVSISYSISSPANAPASNIKVLVNGRPVATERGLKIIASTTQKIDVNIPQEDCTVTLLTENDNGTSPEANLYLKWKAPEKPKQEDVIKPNLYILAIGISKYDNARYELGFAAKDAGDFSSSLQKQKGILYNDVVVKNLADKEASKINILDGLQWIREKTTRKDVAMIFYAGHGINDNDGIFYMLPVGADIEHLESTCIDFGEIKKKQSTIEGKVIVFIDACHSGNLMGEGGNYINGLINVLTSTVKGAGSITFTSSTGKEESKEDTFEGVGNGVFTKALIEGLKGAASFGDDKEITYTGLAYYISRRVTKLTGDKQHPTMVPTPNTPDFPIAVKQ